MVKDSITFKDDGSVEAVLPKELYLAVVRIQAGDGLGWDEACSKAAELMDSGGAKFRKGVKEEARRLHNSELMKQINAARESIKDKAWEEGADYVRKNESNFQVACHKCGKPMLFSEFDENWDKQSEVLTEAFRGWSHTNC